MWVINPVTREVGTLANDASLRRRYRGADTLAFLLIDSIDECTFSGVRGLVTPAAQALSAAEAEDAERRAAEERERAGGSNGSAEEPTRDAPVAERANRDLREEQAQLHTWAQSRLRRVFIKRWGSLPPELAVDTGSRWGLRAALPHWHGAIYEELLAGRTEDFRWPDIIAALERHDIRTHSDKTRVVEAITGWLERLRVLGLLTTRFDKSEQTFVFSPTGAAMPQQAVTPDAQPGLFAPTPRYDDGRTTRFVILPDGRRRWIPSRSPLPPGAKKTWEPPLTWTM